MSYPLLLLTGSKSHRSPASTNPTAHTHTYGASLPAMPWLMDVYRRLPTFLPFLCSSGNDMGRSCTSACRRAGGRSVGFSRLVRWCPSLYFFITGTGTDTEWLHHDAHVYLPSVPFSLILFCFFSLSVCLSLCVCAYVWLHLRRVEWRGECGDTVGQATTNRDTFVQQQRYKNNKT